MQAHFRRLQGPAAAKGLLTYARLRRRPVGPDIVVSGRNVQPGDSLFRFVGNLIFPAGERGKLSVLIYHRVLAAPDSILYGEIDAMRFEVCMELLAAEFNVLLDPQLSFRSFKFFGYKTDCIHFSAAQIVFHNGVVPVYQIPLFVTHNAIVTNDSLIGHLPASPLGTLLKV